MSDSHFTPLHALGTALVTGATAGIGLEFARQFAQSAHDLVLVARDEDRLRSVAAELSARHGIDAEVFPADLTQPDAVARVAERIRSEESPVEILVNNAGFGNKNRFLDTELERNQAQVDLLVTATTVLSYAAGQAMRDRRRGAIITVSSIAGFVRSGLYSANKVFQTAFTESLAAELAPSGVRATALCPGFTRTEFHDRMQLQRSTVPDRMWLEADDLVRACLRDVDAGKVLSIPGPQYKALVGLLRFVPRSQLRRQSRSKNP